MIFTVKPYDLLSKYYHHHWERYCLDYLPLIDALTAEYLKGSLQDGRSPMICDMGCGTGQLTCSLAARGYPAYGVDLSPAMIEVARLRCSQSGVEFYHGDMLDFQLPVPTDVLVISYDAINYLQGPESVGASLGNLARQLRPGGFLLFDSNTPEIYRRYDGVEEEYKVPGGRILQRTRYIARKREGHTEFRFEIDGDIRTEKHVQRVYSPREMKSIIAYAGLEILEAMDDFDRAPVRRRSQKPLFVIRPRPE
jgi:SAM-dependent methyltransferase